MSKRIRINKKSINNGKEKFGWKGIGEESDPIIIDRIDDITKFITLKNVTSYVLIKNISIWNIKLVKCANISIDNCELEELSILGSHHIKVRNNKFLSLFLVYCRESVFIDNYFHPSTENFTYSEIHRIKSDKSRDNLIKKCLGIFLTLFIISILFFIFSEYFWGVAFLTNSLPPLLPLIYYRNARKFTKDFGENFFKNNTTSES